MSFVLPAGRPQITRPRTGGDACLCTCSEFALCFHDVRHRYMDPQSNTHGPNYLWQLDERAQATPFTTPFSMGSNLDSMGLDCFTGQQHEWLPEYECGGSVLKL